MELLDIWWKLNNFTKTHWSDNESKPAFSFDDILLIHDINLEAVDSAFLIYTHIY